MTLKEMMSSIKGNLGGRVSGTVGSENIDTVVLRAINAAMVQCNKLANPHVYEGTFENAVGVPNAGVLHLNETVKDVLYVKAYDASGNLVSLTKKTLEQFLSVASPRDSAGNPSMYTFHQGMVYFWRIPEPYINVVAYCEFWPTLLTSADFNFAMPIGPSWELAVEAFATYYIYTKLQQTQVAESWRLIYEDQKKVNIQVDRKSAGRNIGAQAGAARSACPELDPFVMSNRSMG